MARLAEAAQGTPVLAKEPGARNFAQAGIRVWAANPFTQATQGEFLDILHGCVVPDTSVHLVVVDEVCRGALNRSGCFVVATDGHLSVLAHPESG